jgi:hypothetical protein
VSIASTGLGLSAGKRWGRVNEAVALTGLSRSYLYKMAAKYKGLFRKQGRSTIVDLPMLNGILSDAPPAEITTSS